ncbi:UDP-sugar pyrophosphorylase [Nitzschia inconspicua]|uniref:UDP-sugar pyrophosphorylase n=1 Tax=Nitzschia inconspicua TaxID=303405 RepID=A0A9K3L1W3_9STRA|nr:UDP-sugar pyrophosphorylase [Nitzschia inconspicua]
MRFLLTAILALVLLETSVSSFGTRAPSRLHMSQSSRRNFSSNGVTFMSRGGSSQSSKLSASIEATATVKQHFVSLDNLKLLSERGRNAILRLIENDAEGYQKHVYGDWPEAGVEDEGKRRLADQLADLDISYPGGLGSYLSKARVLLKESAEGVNPFADFEAVVPEGEILSYDREGTMNFSEAEKCGIDAMSGVVFVLVAGGLGERLGYSGIKLSLETNLCTNQSYLEIYTKFIQAMQDLANQKNGRDDIRIPLVIMTSGDTDKLTRKLLKDNHNFGMEDDMITIIMQDKVAALKDGNAGLALDESDRWSVQTKPHGHGDVHQLLFREGLVDKWVEQGKTHAVFLQDTNALVINSVIPALGVCVSKGFHMNSICIPRLPGEAAGAIAKLEHKTDTSKSLVINVEYNQLDPLLRSQGDGEGDVADPSTGFSPFPGNANNLVIELGAYAKTLHGEDQGVVIEFVNPKYKDGSRTEFKKPTRLECMMQDIPKLFQKEMGSDAIIGFTTFDRWFTFSPAKNSLKSGVEAIEQGSSAPGTLSSAESDNYIQNQKKLRCAGVVLPVTDGNNDLVSISGIPVTPGPRIILCPSFAITQEEILNKVTGNDSKITQRSSLVLDGRHITIRNLDLDGALVIRAGDETFVTVDGLKVQNGGWELVEMDPNKEYPETVTIRGYTMEKKETTEYILQEPGEFLIGRDGLVQKVL